MMTAVDTNVLIDVFRNDPEFAHASAAVLRKCIQEGRVIACDIVWSELAAVFHSRTTFQAAMQTLSIGYSAIDSESAMSAGESWRNSRTSGGTPVAGSFPIFSLVRTPRCKAIVS